MESSQTQENITFDAEALIQAIESTVRDAVSKGELDELPGRLDELIATAAEGAEPEELESVSREVRMAIRSVADEEQHGDVDTLVDRVSKAVRGFYGKSSTVAASVGSSLRDRIRSTVEGVRGTGRMSVVMVRVNAETRERMDQLIDGGLVGSRSEAAAYLIAEGIKAREDLFSGIAEQVEAIKRAKEELQRILSEKS